MNKSDFKHECEVEVRWGDLDLLGHVNNAQLVRYLECGRVAYCRDVLQFDFVPGLTEGWILAELTSTFHRQVQFPGTVTVATRCSRLSQRSGELAAALFSRDSEELLLSSRAVIVWFDYVQQRSTAIPDSVRNAIRQYELLTPEAR